MSESVSDFDFSLRSSSGVGSHLRFNDDDTVTYARLQDCTDIIDYNRAMASENNGYSSDKTFRRVGSIPWVVLDMWRNELGIDANTPEGVERMMKLLNDADYRYLRSAEYTL